MTHQPSLPFDDPPAVRHSRTSRAAADGIAPVAGTLRRAVYEWLTERGALGATDEAMQRGLEMNPSTQRPRRVELVRMGLVRDSGRTELTSNRRKATVWIAVSEGGSSDAVGEEQQVDRGVQGEAA